MDRRLPLLLLVGALAAACGNGSASSAGRPSEVKVTKVITIVEENHGAAAASNGMPFLNALATTYGSATDYQSLTHPSLPNYLAMAGGSAFDVHDDSSPTSHPLSGASVFDAALSAAGTAKSYVESMSGNCQRADAGAYAVKHNPWTYFADSSSRANCATADVPAGTTASGNLRTDVIAGRLPQVGLLIPNLCHDAHSCSLATADSWLKSWVRTLMAGPDWKAGRLAIVVTFDEVEGSGSGPLLTAVAWPGLHHNQASTRLSHLSWSRWMTDLAHVPPLRQAAGAMSLGRAFGLA